MSTKGETPCSGALPPPPWPTSHFVRGHLSAAPISGRRYFPYSRQGGAGGPQKGQGGGNKKDWEEVKPHGVVSSIPLIRDFILPRPPHPPTDVEAHTPQGGFPPPRLCVCPSPPSCGGTFGPSQGAPAGTRYPEIRSVLGLHRKFGRRAEAHCL